MKQLPLNRKEGLKTASLILQTLSMDGFLEFLETSHMEIDFNEVARLVTDLITEGNSVLRQPSYDELAEPKE